MFETDYRYSLCITCLGTKGRLMSCRIADFITEEQRFVKAHYHDKEDAEFVAEYDPAIIGSNPDELKLHAVEIRKWIPYENDITKQRSYLEKNLGEVLEIVTPKEFRNCKKCDCEIIREILYSGIELDEEIPERFLLSIGEKDDEIKVLMCKKSDFNREGSRFFISPSVKDMLHDRHYFEEYVLDRNDIVTTYWLGQQLYFDIGEERRFYNRMFINQIPNKFMLRDINGYFSNYLHNYVKANKVKYQITKNEARNIINIIRDIIDSNVEMNNFFRDTGVKVDDFEKIARNKKDIIVQYFEENTEMDQIIKHSLLNDEQVYESCLGIVKERWMEEKNIEREKIENELLKTHISLQQKQEKNACLEKQKDALNCSINQTEIKLLKLKDEIKEQEVKKRVIEDNINNSLKKFREDIVYVTEMVGVATAVDSKRDNGNVSQEQNQVSLQGNTWYMSDEATFSCSVKSAGRMEEVYDFFDELEYNISQYLVILKN